MAQKNKNKITDLSFEQAIDSLSGIVEKIETGQVSLAESLEQYEKGMAMIKHCRGILLDAEKRIGQISDSEDREENEVEQDDGLADDDSEDDSLF